VSAANDERFAPKISTKHTRLGTMTAPPPEHDTFLELFADPSHDPLAGQPANLVEEYFHRWRVKVRPPSTKTLHDDILTDFDSNIGAIGFFVKDAKSSSGVLKVCHGFKRHPGAPGQSSVNRGKTSMYEGDALGIDIATYEFDESQLAVTDEVQTCKDPARHLQLLEDEPSTDLVGPIEDAAANKEVYRTRKAMFIPCPLVQFVLGKDITAREAFEILYPVILDNS